MGCKEMELINRLESIDTEQLLRMSMNKFAKELVENHKLFGSERDLKLFVLEYMVHSLRQDGTDYPIRYYEDKEEVDPHVEEEALTDDLVRKIQQEMNTGI